MPGWVTRFLAREAWRKFLATPGWVTCFLWYLVRAARRNLWFQVALGWVTHFALVAAVVHKSTKVERSSCRKHEGREIREELPGFFFAKNDPGDYPQILQIAYVFLIKMCTKMARGIFFEK